MRFHLVWFFWVRPRTHFSFQCKGRATRDQGSDCVSSGILWYFGILEASRQHTIPVTDTHDAGQRRDHSLGQANQAGAKTL